MNFEIISNIISNNEFRNNFEYNIKSVVMTKINIASVSHLEISKEFKTYWKNILYKKYY